MLDFEMYIKFKYTKMDWFWQ